MSEKTHSHLWTKKINGKLEPMFAARKEFLP